MWSLESTGMFLAYSEFKCFDPCQDMISWAARTSLMFDDVGPFNGVGDK